MSLAKQFAADFRAARTAAALTQEQTAELLGISTRGVQKIERGHLPKTECFLRACYVLRIDPSQYVEAAFTVAEPAMIGGAWDEWRSIFWPARPPGI